METLSNVQNVNVWVPFALAITAVFGWTYKLNRDLRSDLREEMSKNKQDIVNNFNTHIHEPESGEVLLRALAK